MSILRRLRSEILNHTKRYSRLFATGFAMGTADLVPGVSGGTIAFLSGIYEELIYSIKLVTGEVIRLLWRRQFKKALKVIPFRFLVPLGVGLFTALLTLARLLTWLLSTYPVLVWAFFFGLVLASTYIVLKRVVKWDLSDKLSFGVAAVLAYFVVGSVPVETPPSYFFMFISGMIAICAMILPGISGSFILLLLGKYNQILEAVVQRDVGVLAIFLMGAVLGIAVFSRVLGYLFSRHHDISVAILAGLMLGSSRKIWPWKEAVITRINSKGLVVPVVETNYFPATLDTTVFIALFLMALGGMFVWHLDRKALVREQTRDIESKEFVKIHKKSLKNQ